MSTGVGVGVGADPLAELDDLVRRRFHGEELAGQKLLAHESVLDLLRAERGSRPDSLRVLSLDAMFSQVTGLPIVVDPKLPPNVWQLVDDAGKVLQQGVVA